MLVPNTEDLFSVLSWNLGHVQLMHDLKSCKQSVEDHKIHRLLCQMDTLIMSKTECSIELRVELPLETAMYRAPPAS